MIKREDFNIAVNWILDRTPNTPDIHVTAEQILEAFNCVYSATQKAKASFLVPDLFPGTPLECLYIDNKLIENLQTTPSNAMSFECSKEALIAIGHALYNEMLATGTDVVHKLISNDKSEVIIFKQTARGTVLQATGITLLPDSD